METSSSSIHRVVVLGSGVMGSSISALLAGAGVDVFLLDLPSEGGDRNRIVRTNLEKARGSRPSPFYSQEDINRIRIGNFEDDLHLLKEADWVIEVVVENMEVKKKLFSQVLPYLSSRAILSTNTSGLDIEEMAQVLPEDCKRRFLGTHFFNPPRYMKLLEVIPLSFTDPEVVHTVKEFAERRLGKGVIFARNTPNFIANRIGAFSVMYTFYATLRSGFTVAEVDAILGPPTGKPRSAVFRTADMVGVDTLYYVVKNLKPKIPDDPFREIFEIPPFLEEMVKKGYLGNKAGGGFYKRGSQGERWMLNLHTLAYEEEKKPNFPILSSIKEIDDVRERVKTFFSNRDDPARKFAWDVTSATLHYCAEIGPEIAGGVSEIDKAMRWGYNWELGPFELWDLLGVREVVEEMEKDGRRVPRWVKKIGEKYGAFYGRRNGTFFSLSFGPPVRMKKAEEDTRILRRETLREKNAIVEENGSATLYNLGDGVLLLEFHTKMNAVDPDIISMMNRAVDLLSEKDWKGLLIGNFAENFSAGANLFLLYMNAKNGNFSEIERMVESFQSANMRLKYGKKPVVSLVAGMALGGGCEIAMHSHRVILCGEAYVGLVETGVGLVPGGGGAKELLWKLTSRFPSGVPIPYLSVARRALETIGFAKVSTSGKESVEMGFFNPEEVRIVLNRDHLFYEGKREVLYLWESGFSPPVRKKIPVGGGEVYGALLVGLDDMKRGGYATEYDFVIGRHLATILSGGKDLPEGALVEEEDLLEKERRAFLALLSEEKTMERIEHMLTKNRPLRN